MMAPRLISKFGAVGVMLSSLLIAQENPQSLRNPYFSKTTWKIWREDAGAVAGVKAYSPPATEPGLDLGLPPVERRLWPVEVPAKGRFLEFSNRPNRRFAGLFDDVYASWSGTHGWLRDHWAGTGGNEVRGIAASVLGVVDLDPVIQHERIGVNFYHQSTTGMGHAITNAVRKEITEAYERIYFSSGLICAPCHLSFAEEQPTEADGAIDLYMAYMPTIFNSVGSSDSETMAITKMMIAGAYLRPELKLELKRGGLYASAMLWLWKSCLPIDCAFDEEWKHRVAYAAVGDRALFPGGYGATGLERGDMALDVHRYDDTEHLRRMVETASGMDSPPPEAAFTVLDQTGGRMLYALKKTACIIQASGEDIDLLVSAEPSFDLRNRPLTFRWRLLYGNRWTSVERQSQGSPVFRIRVPSDDSLPEGRTTLLLLAHNGKSEGNPAALTIYRKKGAAPPSGLGYQDYAFDRSQGNRRPVLLGLQDHAVKPGETLTIPLSAIDPEGFPVHFTKRAGDPGEIDGSRFLWKVPAKEPEGVRSLTILASDGSSGHSYDARTIRIHIGRKPLPRILADRPSGPAPLTVKLTTSGPPGDWAFARRAAGDQAMPEPLASGTQAVRTFDEPGIYEAFYRGRVQGNDVAQRVTLFVRPPGRPAEPFHALSVLGNGVFIADGDATPDEFDHTDFGVAVLSRKSQPLERTFLIQSGSSESLSLGRAAVKLASEGKAVFTSTQPPRQTLEPGGSARFTLRYSPIAEGRHSAGVTIEAGSHTLKFTVAGSASR